MKVAEILTEWKSIHTINGDNILENPSNSDLEQLLKKSKYGGVRLTFDSVGNLLVWNADNLTHNAVAEELGTASAGFSLAYDVTEDNYIFWADETEFEKHADKVYYNPRFQRMIGNKKLRWDDSSSAYWKRIEQIRKKNSPYY